MARFPTLLTLLALAPLSAEAAFLRIDFSGTANSFNIGPFAADSPVVGSFLIDLSVPDTGVSTPTFIGALQDFTLSVASFSFSGDAGKLDSVDIGGPEVAFRGFLGDGDGTVAGSVPDASGDFVLDSIYLEGRIDASLLLGDLTAVDVDDFGFLRLVMDFTHPTAPLTDRQLIMTTGEFTAFAISAPAAVPLPAAAWLFAGSLTALGALGRRARPERSR